MLTQVVRGNIPFTHAGELASGGSIVHNDSGPPVSLVAATRLNTTSRRMSCGS